MNQSEKDIIYKTLLSTTVHVQSTIYPFDSMKLSLIDWIMPADRFAICCVYIYDIQQWPFYKKKLNDEFMNVNRLIISLTKLLEYYPLLTGVLKRVEKDKTTSIVFENDNGGILFNSVSINIPLNDLLLNESVELTNKIDPHALFHIRHTRFLCGSVALTINLNHGIADAHSYFQLVKDWVRMYHDLKYQPIVCHDRSLFEQNLSDIQVDKYSWPNFNKQKTLMIRKEMYIGFQSSAQIIKKIFRFSNDELERMKKEAIVHLPSEIDYVSTFDVLAAHLYRHVVLARNCSHSSITKLYISTDIRFRLKQPIIPSNYFGNAVLFSYLEKECIDLIRIDNLGFWASEIHQAIAAKTSDEIKSTFAWIISQVDKSKIMPTCDPTKRDFLITAWNKLSMYSDSDFEFGVHPNRIMLPLGETFNGAAILCSTEKNDNSIDVILGLDIKTMEQLEKNSDFRKYC